MNKKLITGIIIIVLVLSACQVLKNTVAVEPAGPTLTPSIETATNTRQPTKTATAIPPTGTADIQAMQTQQADDLLQAEMDNFPYQCIDPGNKLFSNGKNWLAIECGPANNQSLEILNKSGIRWILPFSDYIPHGLTNDGSTPFGRLIPIQWTKNEEYLYFVSHVHADGGGICFYGMGDLGLFRINLNNRNIKTILPLTTKANFYYLSFSPDGRWLAYGIDKLFILDLQTGKRIEINVESDFGNLTWSPDSSKLAFATCQTTNDGTLVDKSAIQFFSMNNRILQTIFEEKDRFFVIYSSDNQKMEILSQDSVNYADIVEYYYDWSSEELKQITLTPTPMQ
ncbi:MAG: hypothetical protein C0410_12185 [Anaerolinea sp.]|nr:hypothetical protein [Anaerolinea sp.]